MEQWLHNTRGLVIVALAIATGVLLLAIDPGNGFPFGVSASSGGQSSTVTTTTSAPSGSTTTSTTVAAKPTLQQGSTGPDVTVLQQRLAVLGYTVTADGQFGAGTKAAVVTFQQKAGLTADGVVNQATWTALNNAK